MSNYFNFKCSQHPDAPGMIDGFNRGGDALQTALDSYDSLVVTAKVRDALIDYAPTHLDQVIDWLRSHDDHLSSVYVVDEYGRAHPRPSSHPAQGTLPFPEQEQEQKQG